MSRFFSDPEDDDFNFNPKSFGYNQEDMDRLGRLLGHIGSPDPFLMAKEKVEEWYRGLSDDQQFAAELAGVASAAVGSFGWIWANGKLRNLAIRKLWDWYMVPLGLRPITKDEANGVSSLIMLASGTLALSQLPKQKEDSSVKEAFFDIYKKLGRDTAVTLGFLALGKFEQMRKK